MISRAPSAAAPLRFDPEPLTDHLAPVIGVAAFHDPATSATWRSARRRAWRPLVIVAVAVAVSIVGIAASAAAHVELLANAFGVVLFVATLLLLAAVASQPLRSVTVGATRRVLCRSRWQLVEVIQVTGAPADRDAPLHVLLDPATARPAGTWIGDAKAVRWPGLRTRRWAYAAVAPDARRAVLAPLDRSALVLVRARNHIGTTDALHDWAWTQATGRWVLPPAAQLPPGEPGTPVDGGLGTRAGVDGPRGPIGLRGRLLVAVVLVAAMASINLASNAAADRGNRRAAETVADGLRAPGEVVERTRLRDSAQIVVEVTDADGVVWEIRRDIDVGDDLGVGDRVEVAYRPGQMEQAVVLGHAERSTPWIVWWIVILVLAASIVAWPALRPWTTRTSDDPAG